MRFMAFLNEDYLGTMYTGSRHEKLADVYVNPTKDDCMVLFKDLSKRHFGQMSGEQIVRYIIDERSENLYVFDAQTVIHADVIRDFHIGGNLRDLFVGEASVQKDGKMEIQSMRDYLWRGSVMEKKTTRWAKKYFYNWSEYA